MVIYQMRKPRQGTVKRISGITIAEGGNEWKKYDFELESIF